MRMNREYCTRLVIVNAHIPAKDLEAIKHLIRRGAAVNVSDFIRRAVHEKIEREFLHLERYEKLKNTTI